MALWEWILLGTGVAFALSIAAALMLAAVLGSISSDVSRMLESEPWGATPPLRAARARAAAG